MDDDEGDVRPGGEDLLELVAPDHHEPCRRQRLHRRGAHRAAEHHLAEELARAHCVELDLVAVLSGGIDAQPAFLDHVQRLGRLAFVNDDRVLREFARLAQTLELVEQFGRQGVDVHGLEAYANSGGLFTIEHFCCVACVCRRGASKPNLQSRFQESPSWSARSSPQCSLHWLWSAAPACRRTCSARFPSR